MFFGPIVMVLFVAICAAILVLGFGGADLIDTAQWGGLVSRCETGLGPSLSLSLCEVGDDAQMNGSAAFGDRAVLPRGTHNRILSRGHRCASTADLQHGKTAVHRCHPVVRNLQ
jgi:hypothetical protein